MNNTIILFGRIIRVKDVIINIIVWCFALAWLFPFIGIVMMSILPSNIIWIYGWMRIPGLSEITFKNYENVLFNPSVDLATGLRNSILVASLSTLIPLLASALIAYAFNNFDFKMKGFLFGLLIFVMMVPQQMCVIPLFLLYQRLKLYNTLAGIILLHSAWGIAWTSFFLRNYFRFIPKNLIEASRVDGASDIYIFAKIVLPLAKPGLIAAGVIQFTWVWNDLFYALVFLVDPNKYVITQKVVQFLGQHYIDWGALAAGSVITMSLPLLLYMFFNKYFTQGVAGWGLKR